MELIEFPQPEHKAPALGTNYWWLGAGDYPVWNTWQGSSNDYERLNKGAVYLEGKEAENRRLWNRQQVERHRIPVWFHAFGPNVEVFNRESASWESLKVMPRDWLEVSPSDFRVAAKPQERTVVVDGREFKWEVGSGSKGYSFSSGRIKNAPEGLVKAICAMLEGENVL